MTVAPAPPVDRQTNDTIETHEAGLRLAERYNLSTHEAMIAAAALHADCNTLWSEGTQHGMALGEGCASLIRFERQPDHGGGALC